MDIIKNIMHDFYHCCGLPVLALDTEHKELARIGFHPEWDGFYSISTLLAQIPPTEDCTISQSFSLFNNLSFLVVPISRFNKYRGFFIIGPIRCKSNEESSIPYRPAHCLDYLPTILQGIADSNFSKGMSNLKYSLHVKKAIQYIHENYTNDLNLDDLCKLMTVNKSYFCKLFKKETQYTFTSFLNHYRVEKSKFLLQTTDFSLLEIAVSVGFNNQSYYSSVFKKLTNLTPNEFRGN